MNNLVDAKKLAEALDLPSVHSVWRLVKLNRIPYYRVGSKLMRFDLDEVRDALAVFPDKDWQASGRIANE